MKLLVVGGTGGTGRELIKQALEQGHTLTALVRKPEKLKIAHPKLQVIKGNVLDVEKVEEVVAGHEAVLSALGHKNSLSRQISFQEEQRTLSRPWRKRM